MLKRLLLLIVAVLLVAAVGAVAVWNDMLERINTAHDGVTREGVFVTIEPGASIRAIASRLVDAGIVVNDWTFRFALWRSGRDRDLQAGEYLFDTPLSPLDVVAMVADGRVFLRTITFPEGLTLSEMAAIFETEAFGDADAFAAAARHVALVADLDPNAIDLEGYLFPETYALPRDATAYDLVEAMVTQFRQVFDDDLRARAAARELSVRQVVTLASIIEKETSAGDEHALVSAVYNNRIRIGMPLQSDPTVIYALLQDGLYENNLTRDNLQYDSPYNTYRYRDLPPGPIAAPGGAVLRAALDPAEVTYLYFVSRNDGTHAFANTLREHNRNVREFQVEYFRRRRAVQ